MNICFYTDYAISGMTGGIGRVTATLTNHFRKNFGWKVYSIYAFEPKADCEVVETEGSVCLRLHDRLGVKRLSKNYTQAASYLLENKIDVFFIQTSMDVVAKIHKVLKQQEDHHIKIIAALHYTPGTDEFPILWSDLLHGKISSKNLIKGTIAPIYNFLEHRATVNAYKRAYKYGDQIVLLSPSYISKYMDFAQINESSKLIAIPNCIPFEYEMSMQDLKEKHKTALVVGRMTDFPKRISLILRMWQQIEKNPNAKDWDLQLVGDGPDLAAFQKIAVSMHLKRCTFVGRQNPFEYYRRASLFLMASQFEGFPMTIVEAQQMGCIPIAFDSFASLREVISDYSTGCIVPNNDENAFVQRLNNLMSNQNLRGSMAAKAIADSKRFSKQIICNRWKRLLEAL